MIEGGGGGGGEGRGVGILNNLGIFERTKKQQQKPGMEIAKLFLL